MCTSFLPYDWMRLCSMHVSACIKQSNFHPWTKRSAFSSSKRHPLDKEYFACLMHVSEPMKNLLMHISSGSSVSLFLHFESHPRMIFMRNHLLHWIRPCEFWPGVFFLYCCDPFFEYTDRQWAIRLRLWWRLDGDWGVSALVFSAVFFLMCLWNECSMCLTSSLSPKLIIVWHWGQHWHEDTGTEIQKPV